MELLVSKNATYFLYAYDEPIQVSVQATLFMKTFNFSCHQSILSYPNLLEPNSIRVQYENRIYWHTSTDIRNMIK